MPESETTGLSRFTSRGEKTTVDIYREPTLKAAADPDFLEGANLLFG